MRWDLSHELDVLFCSRNWLHLSLVRLIGLLSFVEGEIVTAIIAREIQRLLCPHLLSIVIVLKMGGYDSVLLRFFEWILVESFFAIRVVSAVLQRLEWLSLVRF